MSGRDETGIEMPSQIVVKPDDENVTPVARRKFMYLGGAGALALVLPKEWTTPVVELVATPAYAQGTAAGGTGQVYLADIFRRSMGEFYDHNEGLKPDNNPSSTPAPTTSSVTTDNTTNPPATVG